MGFGGIFELTFHLREINVVLRKEELGRIEA
jgi:hypothetical protein